MVRSCFQRELPLKRIAVWTMFALAACAHAAVPAHCQAPRELSYGTSSKLQRLDLYLPVRSTSARAPLVIWIHGGGLRMGDKSAMSRQDAGLAPIAKGVDGPYQVQAPDVSMLCDHGYAVASLNYRLGDWMAEAAPMAISDAKMAVRYLRAHAPALRLDAARFAGWGNSAGGYLVTMLAVSAGSQPWQRAAGKTASDSIQAAIVWFGAEDRLGRDLNPATYLRPAASLPPMRIVNGDADPVVTVAQARRLHEAYGRAGGQSTLVILRGAGHEDPQFLQTQMQPTLEFLASAWGK